MIHWIGSPGDPRIDAYRHVADPEWLRTHNLFVAEGRLVVDRLIALERYEVASVLVNRAAHDALLPRLSALDSNVYVCDESTLSGITGFNFHRGCLALVARPAPDPPDLLAGSTRLLVLEGVSNPDNVGGLFRTAAALGVDGVLLSPTAGDPLYRKAIRTSMGAALAVPFARLADWPSALDRFRRAGGRLIALTPHDHAVPIDHFVRQIDPGDPLILLVGSEGRGVTSSALAHADVHVRIPIEAGIDSLNVVVAAAIALDRLRG